MEKEEPMGCFGSVVVVPLIKMLIGLSDARQDVILKVKLLKTL